jgi:hypothetical protein
MSASLTRSFRALRSASGAETGPARAAVFDLDQVAGRAT